MNILQELCEKYGGGFRSEGVNKFTNYYPGKQVSDFHVTLKYKGKDIGIKKDINHNPYYIFIRIDNLYDFKLKIRINTVLNSINNIFGKGNQKVGRYQFVGDENYVESIINNEMLVDLIIHNDLTIEISGEQKPALFLKPFRGIESVEKGEEYLEILWLLEYELNSTNAYSNHLFV